MINMQARTPKVDDSEVETARRKLEFKLETGPGTRVTPSGLHRYLDELQGLIGNLAGQLRVCYSGQH